MRWLALLLIFVPGHSLANDWDALFEPGAIAIMRHALAPGTGDPPNLTVGDCSTQRNLDERGRAQARAIGSALRDQGISFDVVLSSQWCRTRETAELLDMRPVLEAPSLNSFFQDFSTRDRQTAETRELIAETDGRLMLVTHQVNISALTGRGARSGEVLVIRSTNDGVELLGSILIQPWDDAQPLASVLSRPAEFADLVESHLAHVDLGVIIAAIGNNGDWPKAVRTVDVAKKLAGTSKDFERQAYLSPGGLSD